MKIFIYILVGVAFIGFLSCNSQINNKHTPNLVEYSNGIKVITASGIPKYTEDIFTYNPIVILHQDTTNTESLLIAPSNLIMGPSGHYYVFDQGDQTIAVYNREGNYIKRFGGRGDGPGEFQSFWFQYCSNTGIVIFDQSLLRTSIFNYDGSLINILSHANRGVSSLLWPAQGNSLIAVDRIIDKSETNRNLAKARAVFISSTGDTSSYIETETVQISFVYDQFARASRPIPYASKPIIRYVPNKGIITTTGEQPILTWYDYKGNCTERITLNIEPNIPTDYELDKITNYYNTYITQSSPHMKDIARQEYRHLIIPEYKAYWTDIHVDDDGFYWLEYPILWFDIRNVNERMVRVLNETGEYLVDTLWPVRTGIVQNRHLLGIQQDPETGYLLPTVYEINSTVPDY